MTNAPERIIDSNTAVMRERLVVASLLDYPDPGTKAWANIASVLAHAPMWWEDPVSGRLAEAIRKCGSRAHTIPSVSEYLTKEDQKWLFHHTTSAANAVSIELAEHEAFDLLARYRGKRTRAAIADVLVQLDAHPEKYKALAKSLINTLKEFV